MSIHARLTLLPAIALVGLTLCATPATSEAQFGKRFKDAVKRTAEDKAIQKATEKESKAIDSAVDGGADQAAPDSTAPGAAATTSATEKKVWANYDFVPGQRTIFFTDFTEDAVGNFPQRLEFKTGGMEIVEFEGGQRALKATTSSDFIIPLPEVLPDKFTIEMDVINRNSQGVAANTFEIAGGRDGLSGDDFSEVGWGHLGVNVQGGPVKTDIAAKDEDIKRYVGKPASFRILGDGKYLKLYADEKRVANIPNALFKRDKALFVRLQARDDEDNAVYVTRIRVAESQKTIYDALSAGGRWTTQGILFDTGESLVKPESTPTLKQIAATLKEHPELKVEIQGHTDNVGKADANLKLSQARAEAVKASLTSEYGVNGDQLTAKGYGDTKASADNKTPEGRANNRRVELVKQ
ncbi:MAG: OmpA family protein [Gemmatimonadales bacterium]|nr:OmpA family protein [Gemmatimonadales bacterium]